MQANALCYSAFKQVHIKYNAAMPSSARFERHFSARGQLLLEPDNEL